jgi:DNA-binding beta-propeller fold protein YncE
MLHCPSAPLLLIAVLITLGTDCRATATPVPTATAQLAVVEGGIAEVLFNDRALLLDQRAEPYPIVKLSDSVEIVGTDKQPLSLLDLRDGDVVRLEGQATGRDTFLAQRIVLMQRAARTLPTATPSITPQVTPTTSATPPVPALDRLPLPGTLLIADGGNNRIIEVAPDRQIVWEFSAQDFAAPDNAFFTPAGKTILVNTARYHQVVEIDYVTRKIIWSFGEWGIAGADDMHLNTPGSARRLRDRRTVVADMGNCRIAIIGPDNRIAGQIGKTGECRTERGYLNKPRGVALLPNGRLLVTEVGSRRVSEMDLQGKVYRTLIPRAAAYPSDAQLTRTGNVLIAAYEKPGRIAEVDWSKQIVWEFFPKGLAEQLDRPSSPIELPNGNIAFSDDLNHRVVIVNRAGKIVWQYGVTGVAGKAAGYLNTPSSIDFRAVPIQKQ